MLNYQRVYIYIYINIYIIYDIHWNFRFLARGPGVSQPGAGRPQKPGLLGTAVEGRGQRLCLRVSFRAAQVGFPEAKPRELSKKSMYMMYMMYSI